MAFISPLPRAVLTTAGFSFFSSGTMMSPSLAARSAIFSSSKTYMCKTQQLLYKLLLINYNIHFSTNLIGTMKTFSWPGTKWAVHVTISLKGKDSLHWTTMNGSEWEKSPSHLFPSKKHAAFAKQFLNRKKKLGSSTWNQTFTIIIDNIHDSKIELYSQDLNFISYF